MSITVMWSANANRSETIADIVGAEVIKEYLSKPVEEWPITKYQRRQIASLYPVGCSRESLVVSEEENEWGMERVVWTVGCSCGKTFHSELLPSVAERMWRTHAGVAEIRRVNDANALSK